VISFIVRVTDIGANSTQMARRLAQRLATDFGDPPVRAM